MPFLRLLALLAALLPGFARAEIEAPVTFEKVAALVRQSPRLRSVEGVLSQLPKSYLSHYTLMHKSHSAQEASPSNPRVILFGPDGTLAMAFNGSRTQIGFRFLEMMQWRPKQRAFEMRVIQFPRRGRARISKANPTSCLGCHKEDPRPNWEPYNDWPGAYAGHDDQLDRDGAALNESLRNLFASAPEHSRYRHLVGLREGYLNPDPHKAYPQNRTPVEHNIHLSLRFNQLNYQRIARLAEATPDYRRYRFVVAAFLTACPGTVSSWVPDGDPLDTLNADVPYDERAEAFLQLFLRRDIDVSDWSTSFEGHPYGLASPNSWSSELLARLLERQPSLAKLFSVTQGYYGVPVAIQGGVGTCEELVRRSHAVLGD